MKKWEISLKKMNNTTIKKNNGMINSRFQRNVIERKNDNLYYSKKFCSLLPYNLIICNKTMSTQT